MIPEILTLPQNNLDTLLQMINDSVSRKTIAYT